MDRALTRKIITGFFLILGLSLFIGAVYYLRSLVLLFFMSFILASAFNPAVVKLEKIKLPRALAILLIYLIFIGLLVLLVAFTIPPLVKQTIQLLSAFSKLLGISDFSFAYNGATEIDFSALAVSLDHYVKQYQTIFGQLQGSVVLLTNLLFSTFSAVFVLITLLIATFYLLLHLNQFSLTIAWMLPGDRESQAKRALQIMEKVQVRLGSWVTGQLMLMVMIGVITYVGLVLLGIPYALPLAIIAAFLEIIPNLGPTIAAIPSIIIAFFLVNPFMSLLVLAFYIFVQQFENNLIVPLIMKGVVDVRPLTTIMLILMGFQISGVIGALLSVPFYITVRTISRELWPNRGPFSDYSDLLKK